MCRRVLRRVAHRQASLLMPQLDLLQHRRRGLLDTAPGHIDHRPAALRTQPPRRQNLRLHRLDVHIVGLRQPHAAGTDDLEPMPANVDQRTHLDGQPNDRAGRLVQLDRQGGARHQRHIRRLHAAIGQVEAGRRLGRTGDAHQHHIGIGDAGRALAVIMREHIVHGVDPAEIVSIHHVLRSAFGNGRGADFLLHQVHHRVQNRKAGDADAAAGLLQRHAQTLIDQGEEHQARFMLDALQNPVEVQAGTDQRPAVMNDVMAHEARERRAGDGVQRLAGAVGHQVQVGGAGGHGSIPGMERGIGDGIRRAPPRVS